MRMLKGVEPIIVNGKFMKTTEELELSLTKLLSQKKYDEVDRLSRNEVSKLAARVQSMTDDELWNLIDKITGGLGYTKEDKDISRIIVCGSIISWVAVVKPKSKVLEIGTGLGRTCYTIISWSTPSLYLTIDSSHEILAIALYRNPYPQFRDSLMNECVKICLCDAEKAINAINDSFDHVIHDGGPNPRRNPTLFSDSFLERLSELIKRGGTLSIFGGKDKKWQDKLYRKLRDLGFQVSTEAFPSSPVLVFHCIKD